MTEHPSFVGRAGAADPTLFGPTLLRDTSRAPVLVVDVPGKPRPQGSMTMWQAGDGTTRSKYPAETVAHRNLVVGRIVIGWENRPVLDEALDLRCLFTFPRGLGHYGSGRNRARLRPSAPQHHLVAPDCDKLLRLVCDALTVAQVWRDDCLAVSVRGRKVWGDNASTHIELFRVES